MEIVEAASVDWSGDGVKYQARYIPAVTVSGYLKAQGLKADYGDRLMDTLQTYRPEGELLVAIAGEGPVEINWLQNLLIPPPRGYEIVCRRWEEFYPSDAGFSQTRLFQVNLTL